MLKNVIDRDGSYFAVESIVSNQNPDALSATLRSMVSALDKLEDVVDRRLEDQKRLHSLDSEMSDMMLDRSRLAQSLDKAEGRSTRLEDANKEVSRRLVTAMETIRSVLEAQTK